MNYEDNRKLIAQAWHDFFVLNKDNITGVKKEVHQSWERSRMNNINYNELFIEDGDVEYRKQSRKNNSAFIDISKPYMNDIYNIINNSDFMITLLDRDGFVLESVLNPRVVENSEFSLINLSESRIGTNAMGTCLYLDKPVQTYAEEHCYRSLHKFTTAAAPIHDSKGVLIGCIGITGFAEDVSVHTLGMAIASSYAIENKIRLSQDKNIILLKNYTSIINNSISDGLITMDNKGKITSANKIAENILEIKEEEVLHRDIKDILIGSIDFHKFLSQEADFYNKKAVFNNKNKPIHCNVSLTRLESNSGVVGFIIMFNKIDKNIRLDNGENKNNLYSFQDIIGESDSIKETIDIARVASQGNSNILILGESGTGKELFAQSIHNNSPRKDKPFIDINCGALPLSLAESELFGYEGGSYTGSRKEGQPGKFELANGGTIFLDEIGELPLSIQAALLRVIQERKVTRIGATSSVDIDIMIIAATNRDLFQSVKNNTFRSDLFYRLNVFNINIPPLRENKEDIPRLIVRFLEKYNKIFNTDVEGVSDEVLNILKQYNWPGNIRELENIIERAVQLAKDKKIELRDLPVYIRLNTDNNMIKTKDMNTLESYESKKIVKTLEKSKGNIKMAAEILGISRSTLYRKILKYNINVDEFRG